MGTSLGKFFRSVNCLTLHGFSGDLLCRVSPGRPSKSALGAGGPRSRGRTQIITVPRREILTMVDDAKLHQFMGQMLADLGGAASVALVRIGDALGLYRHCTSAGR
jgi:hypothetical protein